MKLAILLITKDREDLTAETVKTFQKYNGWCANAPGDVFMYHGDDASKTRANIDLATEFGYTNILANEPDKQLGAHVMRRAMIERAVMLCDPTHIFVLENDWRSYKPMPWEAIAEAFARDDVYAFRLYGVHKQKDGTRPTGDRHAGRDKADPQWTDIELGGVQCQIGDIHWGAPPAIVKTEQLRFLHTNTKSDSSSMRKSGLIQERTVRVVDNVFWHIGRNRTPGFRR